MFPDKVNQLLRITTLSVIYRVDSWFVMFSLILVNESCGANTSFTDLRTATLRERLRTHKVFTKTSVFTVFIISSP